MSGQSTINSPRAGFRLRVGMRKIFLWMLGSGVFLVLLWIELNEDLIDRGTHGEQGRAVAQIGKATILMPKKWEPVHSSKLRGPLRLEFKNIDSDRAIIPGQIFTLQAEISSEEDLSSLHLKWIVPPDIAIEEGERELDMGPFVAGEPQYISLKLKALKEENQQIHLMVSGNSLGTQFGDTAQFNTHDQEIIEIENAELAQRSKEIMKAKSLPSQRTKLFR